MRNQILLLTIPFALAATGCKKSSGDDADAGPKLIFTFKFDSTQARLNNIGQPSTVASGHAAQSPVMNSMSAHYIELAPQALTPLQGGAVIYRADETTTGGSNAIDFSKATLAGNGEKFFSIPLKEVKPGTYEWLRVSIAYQNADVKYRVDTTISGITIKQDFTGTFAGFIGFNTYITSFKIKNQSIAVNGNKKQGFWGFETVLSAGGYTFPYSTSGQSPEGSTTVVNPIASTSPIPPGSCVVTGAFSPGKLVITGNETANIVVEVSFSTNKSFEWEEVVADNKWEPGKDEKVVDMGIRGMLPTIK